MKKTSFILMVLVIGFTISVFTGCGDGSNSAGGRSYVVRYEITGPETIADNVIYFNATGNLNTISNEPLPWEMTITVTGRIGLGCTAIIYNNTETYTAKIFINGNEVASAASSASSLSVTHYLP